MPKFNASTDKPGQRPSDWSSFVRRYVWDDDKTPYLIAVKRLTREQADNEMRLWTLFVFIAASVLSFALLVGKLPPGPSPLAAGIALIIALAAIIVSVTHWPDAARVIAIGPAAMALKSAGEGFKLNQTTPETVFMVILMLCFFAYSLRTIAICQRYAAQEEH